MAGPLVKTTTIEPLEASSEAEDGHRSAAPSARESSHVGAIPARHATARHASRDRYPNVKRADRRLRVRYPGVVSNRKSPAAPALGPDQSEGQEISIRYVPLDEVETWPRNPKQHDFHTLTDSLRRFGFTSPLIPDGETGRLVAGHGRLEALIRMRDAGIERPARIGVDSRGVWTVPVLRGVAFKSEQEAEAYLLADNRVSELGGWNQGELDAMIRDLEDLSGVGFEFPDLADTPPLPDASFDTDDALSARQGDPPAPRGPVFHDPVFGPVVVSSRAQEKTGYTLGNVHNPPAPPAASNPRAAAAPAPTTSEKRPWNSVIQPGAPSAPLPNLDTQPAAESPGPQIGTWGSNLGTGLPHVRYATFKIPITAEEESLLEDALEAHVTATGSLHGFFREVLTAYAAAAAAEAVETV